MRAKWSNGFSGAAPLISSREKARQPDEKIARISEVGRQPGPTEWRDLR